MSTKTDTNLSRLVRFASSSLLCTAVDQMVAGLFFMLLRTSMPGASLLRILTASIIARCASVTLNFMLNQHLVFSQDSGRRHGTTRRFIELQAGVLALSTLGVWWLHAALGTPEWIAKPVVDLLLFVVNYNGQRLWVFKSATTSARAVRA